MTITGRLCGTLTTLAAALVCALLATATVAAPNLAGLNPEQRASLDAINNYFNSIRTIEGKFVQTGPDGGQVTGYFVIDRPGKLRFRYYPPAQLDIIADGRTVAIDDKKLQEQTLVLLSETPLRFLVSQNVDLTQEAVIQEVSADADLITVVMEDTALYGSGRLTLIFDSRTIELKQWTVTDAQGLDTTVALYEVKTGTETNPKWFEINYSKYK
ncbi:LolA family protein [Chthonobacter albigriseus]|uniref:LolA family protein n=1 Tax=Chthonobacter albigriseus TaxID=1683161 RepID=UPI0015EF5628|nr:outer membrane lipoprotein carrier protein LolA [Chthonobacter albigriseus]